MKLTKARAWWPAIPIWALTSLAALAVEMVPIPPPEAPPDRVVEELVRCHPHTDRVRAAL